MMYRVAKTWGVALLLLALDRTAPYGRAQETEVRANDGPRFRVHVEIVVQTSHAMRTYLESAIFKGFSQRLGAELGPASQVEFNQAQVEKLFGGLKPIGLQPLPSGTPGLQEYDKLLHLRISETPFAIELLAQDYDVRTQFLCPPIRRSTRQPGHVADSAIEALLAAFSPIAEFQQLADDPHHVLVRETVPASDASDDGTIGLREGDVLVPVLRREAREEDLSGPQTQVVPWTMLIVDERLTGEQQLRCRVMSSSSRPFGLRRRGRIDQLAIAVRPQRAPVSLKLQTQSEPYRPLAGCHVYLRGISAEGDDHLQLLGVSDEEGRVELPSGDQPIQMLWIKSGQMLLAKLPVVSGLTNTLEVHLAEDPARIRAEADLGALRTELVDLVARRNILMARARAAVQEKDLVGARQLANELDKLPTRAQFNQRIDSVAQRAKAADRIVQARIDQLVDETRSVLGQYLDPREIGQVRSEILAATDG